MANIGHKLFVLLKSASANAASDPANDGSALSAASNAAPVVAMSYADVAAKDIRQVELATVNKIMKKQKNEECALASVAVNELPE